tara:strand:- start:89 stop:1048 length:960 start_codon:yes stop_codon:yes gene_type:complete
VLKVGVIGAGYLGKKHLKILENSSFFDLIGFYDKNENIRENLSKNSNYVSFDQIDSLIDANDTIIIATPTLSHFELAKKVLNAKKHVFIEKPICSTVEQAYQLTNLEDENKVFGQVGHVERFNPAFEAIKSSIDSPQFIEAHRFAEFNPRGTDVSVVLDLMIHDIDIVLSVVKSEIKKIDASGFSVISETPDICNARIIFENGCVANLTANRVSLKKIRKTRFFFKNRYVEIDYLTQNIEIVKVKDIPKVKDDISILVTNAEGKRKKIVIENPIITKHNSIQKELEDFYHCILENRKPRVSLHDGARALEVAKKIMESI